MKKISDDKNLKNSLLTLSVWYLFMIIVNVMDKEYRLDLITYVPYVVYMVGSLLAYIMVRKKLKIGGIISIVTAIIMIIPFPKLDFFSLLLGFFLVIYSIPYLKKFN